MYLIPECMFFMHSLLHRHSLSIKLVHNTGKISKMPLHFTRACDILIQHKEHMFFMDSLYSIQIMI
jgi:hypothetical protein